jgi:hypothetical protein
MCLVVSLLIDISGTKAALINLLSKRLNCRIVEINPLIDLSCLEGSGAAELTLTNGGYVAGDRGTLKDCALWGGQIEGL